ncbi:NYN domain-containing protein [Leptospira sp. GIMC2001]|uniref:NYN domain-containing protein n=1 Tax=Leptospira sp. GIMC2001 TaxID=1513297 RepID=UPI00234B7735|nr:NYN domain-containing protein [Leptospira sp. GIMC2001]WCL49085.1 NYN domain-containing protein [Leptospira sp. GIMC2001]
MKILIDAFNLIYKFPELEICMYDDRLDEAKLGLIKLLAQVQNVQKFDVEFLIFVDGQKTKGDYDTYQETIDGMEIFYSQEKEADDLIREFIKSNPFPNHLILVTSDKKIRQFARQFKVKCLTSEEYSDQIRLLFDKPADPDDKPVLSEESRHESDPLWAMFLEKEK